MIEKKTIILGLTGSIGMGKTTTAKMFSKRGIPVWDADKTVHYLYKDDKETIRVFRKEIPQAIVNNQVSRGALKKFLIEDDENIKKIEKIIHPIVAKERAKFLSAAENKNMPLVVLDIPLLFETGNDTAVDYVAVVTVDLKTQRKRVLDRNTMSEEMFNSILSKQFSNKVKKERADFIISTKSIASAQDKVDKIIAKFVGSKKNA